MGVYERVVDGESLWGDSEFLQILLKNTSEGILTIDSDSRIIFANPAIEDVLGYQPDELVGNSKMKIIPERLRSAHQSSLEHYIETGVKNLDWGGVELPALHKDGYEVPISVSMQEHEYEGERLFTGVFTDITERKEREQRLRARTQELEEFAGVLSHDLRNPLSVAQGYSEIANDTYQGEELDRVQNSLDRMGEIIEDMLARLRTPEKDDATAETLSLKHVMGASWGSILSPYAKIELPDEAWKIDANRARLTQLGENLFRNALEHGGEDVTIRVGILPDEDGFYVEDDGVGLPAQLRDRNWLPKNVDAGSNRRYGLAIVQDIAREHGWEFYLTESESGGARFEFQGVESLQK